MGIRSGCFPTLLDLFSAILFACIAIVVAADIRTQLYPQLQYPFYLTLEIPNDMNQSVALVWYLKKSWCE